MEARQLARNILNHLGGSDNIEEMIYCSNRLRFKLVDPSKVKIEKLGATEGVLEFLTRNGMFQVIVSENIEEVYRYLKKYYVLDSKGKTLRNQQTNILERACLCLSYVFMPILPILLSASLAKILLALLVNADFIIKDGMIYGGINIFLQLIFRYYPLLIGVSAAKYFRCNYGVAIIVSAVLLHVGNEEQSATIFAVLLAIYCSAKVEYLVEQIFDRDIFHYFRHFIIFVVMIPITIFLIAPIGNYASYIFALGILWISQLFGFLVPAIIGFLYPILIFFGMQYGIMNVGDSLTNTFGIDSLIGPGLVAAFVAQGMASFMVSYYMKDRKVRGLGILSGIASFGGIVEPGVLGLNLRLSKPLFAGMASGGIIGLIFGVAGVKVKRGEFPGVLSVLSGDHITINVICLLLGILLAGVITYWIEFRSMKEEKKVTYLLPIKDHHEVQRVDNTRFQMAKGDVLCAPVTGRVMPLSFVNDSVYSQETMGRGVAILPEEDELQSPVNGEVIILFDTNNAIGIQSEEGAEIFIHVGINTSAIKEKLFHAHVKVGDSIKKGDRLITFQREQIKKLGYDTITPISICNCDEYAEVLSLIHQDVEAGMPMTKLIRSI